MTHCQIKNACGLATLRALQCYFRDTMRVPGFSRYAKRTVFPGLDTRSGDNKQIITQATLHRACHI